MRARQTVACRTCSCSQQPAPSLVTVRMFCFRGEGIKIDAGTEIGIVIGRTTKYVKSGATNPYIFGTRVTLDIADRGPRPAPSQFNSDWLQGKGHDTFAPMGPWIVPREFVRDIFNLGQKLWINDKLVQDGSSNDMIHTINELTGAGE